MQTRLSGLFRCLRGLLADCDFARGSFGRHAPRLSGGILAHLLQLGLGLRVGLRPFLCILLTEPPCRFGKAFLLAGGNTPFHLFQLLRRNVLLAEGALLPGDVKVRLESGLDSRQVGRNHEVAPARTEWDLLSPDLS